MSGTKSTGTASEPDIIDITGSLDDVSAPVIADTSATASSDFPQPTVQKTNACKSDDSVIELSDGASSVASGGSVDSEADDDDVVFVDVPTNALIAVYVDTDEEDAAGKPSVNPLKRKRNEISRSDADVSSVKAWDDISVLDAILAYDAVYGDSKKHAGVAVGDLPTTTNFPTVSAIDDFPTISATDNSTAMVPRHSTSSKTAAEPGKLYLCDPALDATDPNPDIHALFFYFDSLFFQSLLSKRAVEVKWSSRMTLCAGLCVYQSNGLCSVRLSQPLLKLRPRSDLVNTLLHEMIHAYLFLTIRDTDHDGHGSRFQSHMHRINEAAHTNITVYHNFHDEVQSYRTHVWRCDGPCKDKPPFYGFCRRSMNRPPSQRDWWWNNHVTTCGGTYHKISEPPKQEKKPKKTSEKDKKTAMPQGQKDMNAFVVHSLDP